jgi:hypothetical protein
MFRGCAGCGVEKTRCGEECEGRFSVCPGGLADIDVQPQQLSSSAFHSIASPIYRESQDYLFKLLSRERLGTGRHSFPMS